MIQEVQVSPGSDKSLRELFGELWENTEKLARQEFELAVAELDIRIHRVKRELTAAAIGGAVLYAGLLTLLAALVLLLAQFVISWLAALIVGVAAALGGYLLLHKGTKELDPGELVPKRAARSIKRDVQVFKEATHDT